MRITRILSLREQRPAQEEAVIEQRQRMFTLTMRAYDEARGAIAYVRRRDGDAESIAPNLYTGRAYYRPTNQPSSDGPTTDDRQASGAPGNAGAPRAAVTSGAVAAAVAAQKGPPSSRRSLLS